MKPRELFKLIRRMPRIEGVTYSGGEPMAQPRLLYRLSRMVKSIGLTVVSYSGYTIEELRSSTNPWVHRLLGTLDILIDGRYEENQQSPLPWRGSQNQRVHFLSGAYRDLEAAINHPHREIEFIVGMKQLVTTGIFSEEFVRRLQEVIESKPE